MGLFSSPNKKIYLDHAAATPVDPAVFRIMEPYFCERFANPSALYTQAVKARYVVDTARSRIAETLVAQPDQIIFTSGGTESNNLAILGIARKHIAAGNHIIIGKAEHSSVLAAAAQLEKEGFDVQYVATVKEAIKALKQDTILVSLMYANNEIGTIYPIDELGRALLKWRKKNSTEYPYLHTDACQAFNYIDVNVERLHVDLLTLNSTKIYGPKGVGCLYVRNSVTLEPLMYGGKQERNIRSGTENVPAIIGFGASAGITYERRADEYDRLSQLQQIFWELAEQHIPDVKLNGNAIGKDRLVNNINISFLGCEGEQIVLYLDALGIACSSGSACSEDNGKPSHVLEAEGYDKKRIEGSVRFTLGRDTTKKDVVYTVKVLQKVCEKLRDTV